MNNHMIHVLDHGYVTLKTVWGSDEHIISAARMSTGKGFIGWGTREKPGDEKLLKYLWVNKHTSPFEQAGLSVEVQAPIMVFREWMRHRTQSYNEMSARYTQMPDLHYLPKPERIRRQASHNKQGASEEMVPPDIAAEFLERIAREQRMIYETYQWAIDHGIAREIARINTPVSRYSRMVASANLLNWLRFLTLRIAPTAQEEIREYARAVGAFVREYFPRTWGLFCEHPL